MKKWISLAIVCVMMFAFASCGGTAEVDLQAVKTTMQTDLSITNAYDLPTDKLMNIYGIPAESVADNGSFTTMGDVFPGEILMLKAVDETAAADIAAKLQTRLDSLKVQSANYDPASYEIAQACTVKQNGVYVAMFFDKLGAEMEAIYDANF